MDHEFKNFPLLTTSLFGGLFSGFLLGFVNLIYDLIYRGITHYSCSKIINALSIILFSVLLLVIAGLIYFFLAKYVKKGSLLYSALCIAATIFLSIFLSSLQYAPPYSEGFKWLCVGVIIITGAFAAFLVPYFVKHRSFFL